jgi:hypothetical protein
MNGTAYSFQYICPVESVGAVVGKAANLSVKEVVSVFVVRIEHDTQHKLKGKRRRNAYRRQLIPPFSRAIASPYTDITGILGAYYPK